MKAQLILENGKIFNGRAFGHIREAVGEVVFNTSMAGYQEIITDPSNYGKIITMTYPLVGNYGLNLDDSQSKGAKIKALIVREKADNPSNWRNEMTLDDYLKQHRILGLEGIDTRALTKIIRNEGSMKAIITMRELSKGQIDLHFETSNDESGFEYVSTKEKYVIEGSGKHIGLIDLGITNNIIDSLKKRNAKLTVYPHSVSTEELIEDNLDGILVSNGPGNPEKLTELASNLKLLTGKIPLFGIGLGNEVLALSLGAKISKMKYGHRGSNLPVKDIANNKILITWQNHSCQVLVDSLPEDLEITHKNINDDSVEGIENKKLKAFGVEFYPDDRIFDKFFNYMEGK